MLSWSGHLTWDTQMVVIVLGVLVGILFVGCLLYILYDEPPEPKVDKRKSPSLPYAPPPPSHLRLGPRFAQIEAWKREQEAEKAGLAGAGVFRLRATPPAASASSATDPTRATAPTEADWGSVRPRPRWAVAASSSVPTAASKAANEVQPALHPKRLGTLAELAADRAAEPSWPTAEEAESELAEGAEEAWEPMLPSLRPVHLTFLDEEPLTDDQREMSDGWPGEATGEASGERAEEECSSLRPVQLQWGQDDTEEKAAFEQETLGHQTARVQPSDRQESLAAAQDELPYDLEGAASREATARKPPLAPSGAIPGAMPIAVQVFGRAQLLISGQPIKNRANHHLELVLYLAHQAVMPGEEQDYVDRLIISDELWPEEPKETSRQLGRLRNCKYELVGDVERAGLTLEQCPWLETGPENALRLNSAVPSDLALFAPLVEQIAQARGQAEGGVQDVLVTQVDAWQSQLKHLYQGGVAQQFGAKPWLDKARRHYQAQFFQASFDLARLLVRMGAARQAIDLGTETVLAAMPRGEDMMAVLVEWVQQQEPMEREAWASRFADEYERRYGRTLAGAHEKMETLRQSVLPAR